MFFFGFIGIFGIFFTLNFSTKIPLLTFFNYKILFKVNQCSRSAIKKNNDESSIWGVHLEKISAIMKKKKKHSNKKKIMVKL